MNVPDFPDSDAWSDQLHWCLRVMDTADPDVAFVASLLSHAHSRGGLTEKQARHGRRIIDRLYVLWSRGELVLQIEDRESLQAAPVGVTLQ